MNFFGHALVAAHREPDAHFVLGSMLPDLASMLHTMAPSTTDPRVSEGVAFHHATDRAFHDSEVFRRLNREASQRLSELGVRRGTVRAVAHVGVEYMIDAELLGVLEAGIAVYLEALAVGAKLGREFAWKHTNDGSRFAQLCSDLALRGVTVFRAGGDGIVQRLERALAHRPRLAIHPPDAPHVERWVRTQGGRVRSEIPALLAELSGTLGIALGRDEIS